MSASAVDLSSFIKGGSAAEVEETDVIVVGRNVIRDAVLERIELLGCCGKA